MSSSRAPGSAASARPRTPRLAAPAPEYIAGISSSRWMGVTAALLMASGVLLVAGVVVAMEASFAGRSAVLVWFGSAAIAPVFVLLPFLASSILVLRLTHALAERRRDGRAHSVESRSELGGALCCVLAIVSAGLVQPAAWTQEGMVGWGIVAVVFALLSVVFQFSLGAVVAPDARVQRRADQASLLACERRAASLRALPLLMRRRAVSGLVLLGALLSVVAPLAFELVAAVTGPVGRAWTTGGLVFALALMSIYTITAGQLAQGIAARGQRRGLIATALLLGTAGWVAVAVFEVWALFATGDPVRLAWAGAFAAFAIGCGVATLTRRTGRGWTLHAAVATLQLEWTERRIASQRDRIARLTRLIDAERPLARLGRALRGWILPRRREAQAGGRE